MTTSFDNRCKACARTSLMLIASVLISSTVVLFVTTTTAQDVPSSIANKQSGTGAPRRVLVRSTSLLVRAAVVEDKLLKRPEFKQLGFVITRDEGDADIILELRHDLLTKYVFSVVDVRTQTVVTGGKLSSLGGTVAGKVAKRFVKEMATKSTS